MDTKKWAEQIPHATNQYPEVIDCKPISFEIAGETLTLNVSLHSNSADAVVFSIRFGNLEFGPFTGTHDFEKAFVIRTNKELEKLQTDFFLKDDIAYYTLTLRKEEGMVGPRLVQEIETMRKCLAVVAETALKMLRVTDAKTLKIPNPRVMEDAAMQQAKQVRREEAKEKVRGLEVTDINLTLDEMGGNAELKAQIRRLVAQYRNQQFFEERGVSLPKGILLYGPPGTGKTLSAKIFAGEIGRRFYHVKASDILSKYYGESEQAVRDIFQHVEGPCIIFIDEIDSIGEHRDYASEPTRRVLSELLQQLDGFTSRKDIILLAATNRKESLDPALLRPGRFDRHILVDLPDEEARKQIWGIHIGKQQSNSRVPLFEDALSINTLSRASDSLAGADIEEIVRRTKEKAVFAAFDTQSDVRITTEMLTAEMKSYKVEREKEKREPRRMGFHTASGRETGTGPFSLS